MSFATQHGHLKTRCRDGQHLLDNPFSSSSKKFSTARQFERAMNHAPYQLLDRDAKAVVKWTSILCASAVLMFALRPHIEYELVMVLCWNMYAVVFHWCVWWFSVAVLFASCILQNIWNQWRQQWDCNDLYIMSGRGVYGFYLISKFCWYCFNYIICLEKRQVYTPTHTRTQI